MNSGCYCNNGDIQNQQMNLRNKKEINCKLLELKVDKPNKELTQLQTAWKNTKIKHSGIIEQTKNPCNLIYRIEHAHSNQRKKQFLAQNKERAHHTEQ